MSVRDHDKGRRYVALLDAARCNGSWQEVPELIRKVTKHTPDRKCLLATANVEYRLATNPELRPSTSATTASLPSTIPELLAAIEEETRYPEDRLQAQTCLAWIHWTLAEPALAASTLPKDFTAVLNEISTDKTAPTGLTEVCLVKGACMKGTAQSQAGDFRASIETLQSLLPWITSSSRRSSQMSKELSYWTSQYFAQLALVASKEEEVVPNQWGLALQAFREWAANIQKQQSLPLDTNAGAGFVFPSQPQIWKAYYLFLSRLLQQAHEYPPEGDLSPRLQQYVEFKRVESMYENLLLKTVRFPKAHDSSLEIESWVEQVIRNWRVVCGAAWRDEDLGQGGKDAAGRVVLDILYRAATKTFHSTLILRRLFQVHKSLAEFDLAYKALDTYIDLVKRGKAKAEKSGEPATDIDDNDTVLQTLAEAIESLCCFGSTEQADKARHTASILDDWVGVVQDVNGNATDGDGGGDNEDSLPMPAVSETTAVARRAIGIALAKWARSTPFSEDRSAIQKEAIGHLKASIAFQTPDFKNHEAYFALGLILAETRDLDGAIQCVKEAVASPALDLAASETQDFARERKMIPLWHLLALILSSKQDFSRAEKACEGALQQFPSLDVLFGHNAPMHTNGHLTANDEKRRKFSAPKGLVDSMKGLELERIIEIRMTEIALVEVVEGPEVAINGTNELLSLFVRLFGKLGIELEEKQSTRELVPPKSSAGTVRSFRGSLFNRKKEGRPMTRHSVLPDRSSTIPEPDLLRSPSVATNAPTIQVTDANQNHIPQHHDSGSQHKLRRREGSINRKIRQRSEGSATSRPNSSYVSSRRQSFETGQEELSRNPSSKRERKLNTSDGHAEQPNGISATDSMTHGPLPPPASATAGVSETPAAKQELPEIPHNSQYNSMPSPPGHQQQPPEQDIRLPTVPSHKSSTQLPHFTNAQAQKHALGILIKIWLLIASLYRRATMFDDSFEAISEAERYTNTYETLIASTEGSSAKNFAGPGWGGTKSFDELIADVCAERGLLSLARSSPHDAIDHFEQALSYFPHHGKASIALSDILLDIYTQNIPAERPQPGLDAGIPNSNQPPHPNNIPSSNAESKVLGSNPRPVSLPLPSGLTAQDTSEEPTESLRKTPSNLNRLAARDRAYGLLSAYTKLGSGWDDSEAWFTLARAYEESGEIEKAKEVLWWCVELEDTKPVRSWTSLGSGGYVL